MFHWRVLLEGRNFWLRVDSDTRRLGFYTTRFVEAEDERSAELVAIQLIRDDPKLPEVLHQRSDPPMIYAEEITAVAAPDRDHPNTGYTFYLEEGDA